MSIDKKLLTAFVHGEARGDDYERAKTMVERDPEARKFVEELKSFSKTAAEGLAKEPVPEGKGVAAIKAEIERRGKQAASAPAQKKQYWVEALVVGTLLVAFVPQSRRAIMGYMQSGFQNSQGPVSGGPEQAGMAGPFSGPGETQGHAPRTMRLAPESHEKLFAAVGELEARPQVVTEIGRCKVQLPSITAGKDTTAVEQGYVTNEYATEKEVGGTLRLTVAALSRKQFAWDSGEEYAKGRDYILVKRTMGEQPAVIYFVPELAHEPVCGVQATIEGVDFSPEDMGEAREALQIMAKKIAESTEFK